MGGVLGFPLVCCDFLKSLFMTRATKWERKKLRQFEKPAQKFCEPETILAEARCKKYPRKGSCQMSRRMWQTRPMGLAPATLNLWTGQPPNLGLSKSKLLYRLAGLLQGPVYYLPYGAGFNNQSIRLLISGPSFPCSYNQRGNSGTILLLTLPSLMAPMVFDRSQGRTEIVSPLLTGLQPHCPLRIMWPM